MSVVYKSSSTGLCDGGRSDLGGGGQAATDVLELGTRGPVTHGPERGARGITLAPVQTGSAQGCKFPLPPRAGDRDRLRLSWRREWGEVREWGSLAEEQPGAVGSREPPRSLGPTPVPALS